MHLGLTGSRKKHHIPVVCLLSNSGIYSPAWLVCLCRWATWEASRLRVPGGQEAFTDRQGRIIMYCNGGLWRECSHLSIHNPDCVSASVRLSKTLQLKSEHLHMHTVVHRTYLYHTISTGTCMSMSKATYPCTDLSFSIIQLIVLIKSVMKTHKRDRKVCYSAPKR